MKLQNYDPLKKSIFLIVFLVLSFYLGLDSVLMNLLEKLAEGEYVAVDVGVGDR